MSELLEQVETGMQIVYGGNRVTTVPRDIADAFRPGDRLIVVQDTGALLHVPSSDWEIAHDAVTSAADSFAQLGAVSDDQISEFFKRFADSLTDDETFEVISQANAADLERAKDRGRSTTRLELTDRMRREMITGLQMWAGLDGGRGAVEEKVERDGWSLRQVRSGLGVVGFVFEGRPNVIADATGVLRSGNTVVFRIGSDALGTAAAAIDVAAAPALAAAGLPPGTVSLVDSASRAAGWAMFSDSRLGLAVARGSGSAVSQLGSVARQAGIPVSLHGTGGAWIMAARSAEPDVLGAAVYNSLDRKVCNTLNTICIVADRAEDLTPVFLDALERAGHRRGSVSKLHFTESARPFVPEGWFEAAGITRAEGIVEEPRAEPIPVDSLGVEWEWEDSPEVTLTLVTDVDEAIDLFNTQSPRFAASLISEDPSEHDRFFDLIDAPFVGNGFTRWVDGQYALNRPELGLSNWQFGRLFGRGGILSGDSVYTVRGRLTQSDPHVGR